MGKGIKKSKKKEKKERKDKNAPKRAISAFFYYQKERRESLKEENPNLSNKELISTMSAEWNKMKDTDKKKYVGLANKDKKRYEKEKEEYNAKQKDDKKGKRSYKKD